MKIKFHVQNVKNHISGRIAVKYAPVDKAWIDVTQCQGVSVNLAGLERIVQSISMNVKITRTYVEMKRCAITWKGLICAIVKKDFKRIGIVVKILMNVQI